MRVADGAILICPGTRGEEWPVERYFLAIGSYDQDHLMMYLVEKEKLQRANAALLKTAVCGGLAVCALGAAIYDFGALVRCFARLSFVSNLLFDHSDRRKVGDPLRP